MSTTLFAHPAARLIKHIPPLDTAHVNGALRRDLLGPGSTLGTELSLGVVLADHQGPLQVCSVPDPTMPGMATLVLVIDAEPNESVFGAQRRAVVPFRLFEQNPSLDEAEGAAPSLPPRRVYEGLGAGKHGVDGGSLWFYEDEREQGAMDRVRWNNMGRGNRAVWTIWLISAPAPVVSVLGELLEVHPQPVTKLPPMLEGSFPWRDTYIALPPQQLQGEEEDQQDSLEASAENEQEELALAAAPAPSSVAPRNAPPPMPPKPAALRSSSLTSTSSSTPSPIESTSSSPSASVPVPSLTPTTLGTLRNAPRRLPSDVMPDYRHSLVAVDNETGEVLGILAHDVRLDDSASPVSSDSSSSEEEVVTPLDGLPFELASLGNATKEETEDEEEGSAGQATPKQASVRRAAAVYYDEAARRSPSRTHSVLGADTFAPPPVPEKSTLLTLAPAPNASVRDSMASAAFFSAAESGDESDAPEAEVEEEGWARVHARHASAHRPDLLRDEADQDDDARSDVSGSTIGGPAVKLWRKARGLPKIKPGKSKQQQQEQEQADAEHLKNLPRRRDGSLQRSDASVRTSRAETAMEVLESEREEDDDDDDDDEQQRRFSVLDPLRSASQEREDSTSDESETTISALANEEASEEDDDKLGHMRTSTSASDIAVKLHGHRSRALMGSSEVRSREDELWRNAFESEALPIDAPYTHLAATSLEPVAVVQTPQRALVSTKISDEGMEMQPKGQRSSSSSPELEADAPVSAAATGSSKAALQGGTVLIDFLQGSRIGASLLSGPAASLLAASDSVVMPTAEAAPLRKGAMAYIPVLPSHFLWWLGIADEDVKLPSQAAPVQAKLSSSKALAQAGPDLSAVLSRTGAVEALTHVTSGLSSALSSLTTSATWLFGGAWSTSTSDADPPLISDADRDADAEEWEWAVPEFRADSLASTPRPVYRRRRPNPSPTGGFAVRHEADQVVPRPSLKAGDQKQRYSIIHYDAQGVGRRAFLSATAAPPLGIGGLF